MAAACLCYISIVFWYLIPDQTWICELRKVNVVYLVGEFTEILQWLTVLGFTLLLVGVFSRTYSIIRVFTHLKTTEKLTPNYFLNFFEVFGVVLLITGVQLLILILWTALDSWKATEVLIDDLNLRTEWFCNSNNIYVWMGVEAGFFGFLLIWGLWVVYVCW